MTSPFWEADMNNKLKICVIIAVLLTSLAWTPENAYASTYVGHTLEDSCVMPDKYNTGADESSLMIVTADDAPALKSMFGGIPFKKSSDSLLSINYHGNGDLSGQVEVTNIDFSNMDFAIYNSSLCKKQVRIVFVNCKFAGFGMSDSNDLVYYEFRNCTFENVNGSNMDLYNCRIAGGQSDGIRAFRNTNVVDCYIADKSQINGTTSVGNHVDGVQIYGSKDGVCRNIHFENCRFEIPLLVGGTAPVNSCLMLQIEFCDADDITFSNCKINGGGYSIYAWSKNDKYKLTNARFENITIGCACGHGNIYPKTDKGVSFSNVSDSDSLYVGSVWRDENGTHLSVTNDTNVERTLLVCTGKGETKYTIKACPLRSEMKEGMTFDSLPFDIDINIGDTAWVVCYDITGDTRQQIRYVDYSGKKLKISGGHIVEKGSASGKPDNGGSQEQKSVQNNNLITEGECGGDAAWYLYQDGSLVIKGTGSINDYHSGNKAPWSSYSGFVRKLVIEEGITKIGNQAFRDMMALESVELPSTLETIGKIAFQKCTGLHSIVIPENVLSIGERCFAGVPFETAMYLGCGWSEVKVGDYNECLLVALK